MNIDISIIIIIIIIIINFVYKYIIAVVWSVAVRTYTSSPTPYTMNEWLIAGALAFATALV